MDMSFIQSILYGLFSGLMDTLPVSAQAHKILLLKFFGLKGNSDLMELLGHLGVLFALYYNSQAYLTRMNRARNLAKIPKRKRKRPLDTRSLMDWSLLKTMSIPVILAMFLYQHTENLRSNLVWISLFLFLNGVILYIPQFFPTGNRDSRTLSRVEGILMGIAGASSIVPGISAIGAATSVASVCGVERTYGLSMALMMNLVVSVGLVVYDIWGIAVNGIGTISFMIILNYVFAAAAAFGGTLLGIKTIRKISENQSLSLFGVYCWGLALFTFILNLMA